MEHTVPSLLLVALLAACGNQQQGPAVELDGPVTQAQIDSIVSTFSFVYEAPMQLDSGTHALMPMSIREDRSSKIGISDSYGYDKEYSPRYWNVLFLDLRTQETHLLTDQRMRIDAIHVHRRGEGQVLSRHVLYTIVDQDVNKDGRLDYGDPKHLSISDAAGRGLSPVSPVEEDLQGWNVLEGQDRLIIRTLADTDGDHTYEVHEDANVYVYDLPTRQLKLVVTDDLQRKVNKLFFEQWLKKQK